MRQLHTGTHILNALVFQQFDGALVTGVQMAEDGTARMDFDVPGRRQRSPARARRADQRPDPPGHRRELRLRADARGAGRRRGLIRSRSVAPPPTPDGKIRIVEIAGLDRQACGGTHLASTGGSPPIRILKIDNKGRHNRRIRIGLADVKRSD